MIRGLFVVVILLFVFYIIGGNDSGTSPQVSTTRAPTVTPRTNTWAQRLSRSAIDDSRSVYLTLKSDNSIPGTFGRGGPATLQIRCLENTTSITFNFNDNFMADIQSYGRVTYRVDDNTARTVTMKESTDNKWLGLWRGGQAIPMVKQLFGGERMVVRATPYNESSVEVRFNIAGLEDRIGPLREACHW